MKQSLNAITSTGFPSDRFAALSASSSSSSVRVCAVYSKGSGSPKIPN